MLLGAFVFIKHRFLFHLHVYVHVLKAADLTVLLPNYDKIKKKIFLKRLIYFDFFPSPVIMTNADHSVFRVNLSSVVLKFHLNIFSGGPIVYREKNPNPRLHGGFIVFMLTQSC